MATPTFEDVVAQSGLSELFAADAIERALSRAGVHSRWLKPGDLEVARPELERMLRIFLGADEAKRRIDAILALQARPVA